MKVIRWAGESVLFTALGLLAFVGMWAAVILLLPLLATWWGFVGGIVVFAILATWLENA